MDTQLRRSTYENVEANIVALRWQEPTTSARAGTSAESEAKSRSPLKKRSPSRSPQRQQIPSYSKINSSNKPSGTIGKPDKNPSPLNPRRNQTTNLLTPSSKSLVTRTCQPTSRISNKCVNALQCRRKCRQREADTSSAPSQVNLTLGGDRQNLSPWQRVLENNKLKVFEGLHSKLLDIQTKFMQHFENLKLASPEKLKDDYKFITMVKNGECQLIIKDDNLQRMPKKLPVESVSDFKDKVRNTVEMFFMCLMDSIKLVQNSKNGTEVSLNLDKIEENKNKRLQDLDDLVNTLVSAHGTEIDSRVEKMKWELQMSKNAQQQYEKKIAYLENSHAEELEVMESELKDQHESEISKLERQLNEMTVKLKNLETERDALKASLQQAVEETNKEQNEKAKLFEVHQDLTENIRTLRQQLKQAQIQMSREKKEKQDVFQKVQKLESQLEETSRKLEEADSRKRDDFMASENEKKLNNIIQNLRHSNDKLEVEKRTIEEKVHKLEKECSSFGELRARLRELEEQNRVLQQLGNVHEEGGQLIREYKAEMCKLQKSESERRIKIEKLELELSEVRTNAERLEEQKRGDQHLLELRNEAINSLKANENSHRIHLEKMFGELGEKNKIIKKLSHELRAISERYRNFHTSLKSAQLELTRKENMIQLLEDRNDLNNMLRAERDKKIELLEKELSQLKQTLYIPVIL